MRRWFGNTYLALRSNPMTAVLTAMGIVLAVTLWRGEETREIVTSPGPCQINPTGDACQATLNPAVEGLSRRAACTIVRKSQAHIGREKVRCPLIDRPPPPDPLIPPWLIEELGGSVFGGLDTTPEEPQQGAIGSKGGGRSTGKSKKPSSPSLAPPSPRGGGGKSSKPRPSHRRPGPPGGSGPPGRTKPPGKPACPPASKAPHC